MRGNPKGSVQAVSRRAEDSPAYFGARQARRDAPCPAEIFEVHGEAEDFGGVETAGFAEAHRAAQDGGAGEVEFAGFEDDGFVKRLVFPSVGFADENSQQHGFVWEVHEILDFGFLIFDLKTYVTAGRS